MSDQVSSENWQHYSTNLPKRKRADLVCVACHSKKIKCDLQQQKTAGKDICKHCYATGRECLVRPSKREKRRKHSKSDFQDQVENSETDMTKGVSAILAADARYSAFAEDQSPRLPITSVNAVSPHPHLFSPPSTLHNAQARPRPNTSSTVAFQTTPHPNESPVSQRNLVNGGLTETTPTQTGDVDSGFLQVYAQENQFDANNQALVAQLEHRYSSDLRPDLEQIFTETYFTYCYPWCPVLDRATLSSDIARSPLLANALALASSHIQPPLLPHEGPEVYYKRARTIFYDDEEADETMALRALCLFYWWAPQAPSRVHKHSSWWWTSVIIRHAQQMNIHRELSLGDPARQRANQSLRRRIWWTVFARERLTSLCQSKPVIIDPQDCSIQEPTLQDFPSDPQSQHQGEIFIYWVRLCAIIGRIAKVLMISNENSRSLPNELREELVTWVHSLPSRLRLPIDAARTESFDRDVHQLHLFYLTTIIILHLKRSGGQLPQALPPAIIAASCTARILRDILARGNSRFLMAITCWHTGMAFIALLQACRIQHLSKSANEDLDILSIAGKELQKMWASGNVIVQGFERLRAQNNANVNALSQGMFGGASGTPSSRNHHTQVFHSDPTSTEVQAEEDFDWMRFFPFVTKSTGAIAESLILGRELGTATRGFPSPNNEDFHGILLAQYQNLFDPFTDYTFDFQNVMFDTT